ncbi:hypothetical protein TWF679_006843 [Orbilia oligospora]|uniref:AA9 family lytic polysaccharide monooxygenase n=1 Tax=Orbilia oligospora TaxID=2813651 RepID=A0A8H8V8T2_ORBOL|nr:hypothetical protein TWF679_006843 [Orbilia oligospora]
MKIGIFLVAALAGIAEAHYTFDKLLVNGEISKSWQYIRENTRDEKYMPTKFYNSFGTTPLDTDFRCNQGANSNAHKTSTIEVAPGDKIGFRLAYGARMAHPGPAQVYMSKAPGRAVDYMGDGDWFKVYQATTCGSMSDGLQDTDWCTWNKTTLEFTLPKNIPPGEYLIRPEHIGLHGAFGGHAEFYYVCAQVKVTGNGNGTPGPMVKIPGVYTNEEPALRFSIWSHKPYNPLYPGPPVWDDKSSAGAVSVSSTISSTTLLSTTPRVIATTLATRPTTDYVTIPVVATTTTRTVANKPATTTSATSVLALPVTTTQGAKPTRKCGGP